MSSTSLKMFLCAAVAMVVSSCGPKRQGSGTDQLVGRPVSSSVQRGNLWYKIELRDTRLDIAVRLFAPPDQTRFFLPGEWAGRRDFDQFIGITGAHTDLGSSDVAINREAGEIDVSSAGAAWVQLDYRVELNDQSAFHAQTNRGVFIAFGPAFLVMPSQQVLERTSDIPIELGVPTGFEVVSTWPRRGSATSQEDTSRTIHQFIAADFGELRDAFVVSGSDLRRVPSGEGQAHVEIAFAPTFEGNTEEFAKLVASVTHRFRDLYGPVGPIHAFIRTRSGGTEMGGVGRRGGFILDLPPDSELSWSTSLLVAHEALHMWNGHLLMPSAAVEASTRWFKEGVTHYLALKSLGADEEFVLEELARTAWNYERNPLSRGERGASVDEARFPYDFGVLVALTFDATLSEGSADARIECWLRTLLAKKKRYDEQGLLGALQECAGPQRARTVSQHWRRWVRVGERLDVRKLFQGIGLHYLPGTATRAARLMPLDQTQPHFRRILGLEAP